MFGIPIMSIISIPSGAFAASSSVSAIGRITACGHTYAQRLHWIQLSGCQIGISTAIPRFSYAEEPDGVEPSTYSLNADTGSVFPSCAFTFAWIFFTKSTTSALPPSPT